MTEKEKISQKEEECTFDPINMGRRECNLLHEQMELLAEKSKECDAETLIKLSEQMANLYAVMRRREVYRG